MSTKRCRDGHSGDDLYGGIMILLRSLTLEVAAAVREKYADKR